MPTALWIHGGDDPLRSGELRRLGLPALLVEAKGWRSQFVGPSDAFGAGEVDLVICAMRAAAALSRLPATTSPPILIEVDLSCIDAGAALSATLHALSNRIAGVVARSPRAAQWAERVLRGALPVWTAPDPAATSVELAAAKLRFAFPADPPAQPMAMPPVFDLWFAEPGDMVEDDEIQAIRERPPQDTPLVVLAPDDVRAWLDQAGADVVPIAWAAGRVEQALAKAREIVFVGRAGFSQLRRRMVALRAGAAVRGPRDLISDFHAPAPAAAIWLEVMDGFRTSSLPVAPADSGRILVLLDLVQDLDLALPIIDEVLRRGASLSILMSSWLQRRSPRVLLDLAARGLAPVVASRESITAGEGSWLDDAAAVVTPAESSLTAHERAHALFQRARAMKIPTFSLQHGVENVGLSRVDSQSSEASLLSDHFFVWGPTEAVQPQVSAALRPRMVHVGRRVAKPKPTEELRLALTNFRSIAVVFENLHWDRYDKAWRNQFLTDCLQFASVEPERCVVLKPHHAGLWSTRHTHLFPQWPQNLVLADPTDPFWEPFTAPSLLQLADLVITTPSTVALDAVQAGKPVAVAAYGLDLPAYAPLTMLHSSQDWLTFAAAGRSLADAQRRASFLTRTVASGRAEVTMVDRICAAMQERAFARAAVHPERRP